jgi:putative MATE family efflux protein
VCTGATALVSRHVGARDTAGANRFANQAVVLSMLFGALGAGFLYAMAPTFVALQGLHGDAQRIAIQYLRIDAFGYVLYGVMLGGAASLRGAGDMKAPMLLMGVVNVVNAYFSTVLVYGLWGMPNIGTPGIAVGTLIGRLTGGLLMIALLLRGRSGLKLSRKLIRPRWEDIRRLLRVGVPAGIDAVIHWTGHFVFLMLVGRIGSGAMQTASYAAHMVGVRIEALSFLPAQAWGAAAATLVGQGLGAGRPAVAMRRGLQAATHIALMTTMMGVIYFSFAPQLFGFFSADPLVAEVGVAPLRLLAFVQPALGILIVFLHALRGAGDTRRPVLFTIIGTWGIRLPVAAILVYGFGFGLLGAWIGMAADIIVRASLMSARFLRGRWKYVVV